MENRLALRICLGLGFAVLAAYFPVVNCDFVNYDDPGYVYSNSHVKTGLKSENVVWAWTSLEGANWHPLTWISHQLDCQLFDLQPRPHHLVNLGWHIANTILLYLVLRRMTGEDWRPALVAALFGLHPLHVESVAWVSERKDVTSAFFALVTLGSYTLYAEQPSGRRYLAVLIPFALGLMCKPMLVTWPCVLLLMDYWPLRRTPMLGGAVGDAPHFVAAGWRRLILEKLPLLALAAASSLVTMQAQKIAMKPSEHLALGFRLGNAVVSYATYLRKMVWPTDLAPFYWHHGSRLPWAPVILSGAILILLTLVVLLSFHRRPALLVGWLWYLGTLVPVIGLVQVGLQSMADRYSYIPLIGIFLALAWCVPSTAREIQNLKSETRNAESAFGLRITKFGIPLLAGAVLLICAALTFRQTQFWHDSLALWLRAVTAAENPIVHSYYAGALYNSAELLYEEADELAQKGRAAESERRIALAKACIDEAEQQCRLSVQMGIPFPPGYAQLAEYLVYRNDLEGALAVLSEGVAVDSKSAALHNRLGRVLAYLGRLEEAGRQFHEACRLDQEAAAHHFDLGTALALLGDKEGAQREWELGRERGPEFTEEIRKYAESLLGRTPARRNCPAAAVFHAQEACWSSPTPLADLYQLLAEAYAAAGQPFAAYLTVQRALELAESNGRTDLLPALRQLAHSYGPSARRQEACLASAVLAALGLSDLCKVVGALAVLEAGRAMYRLPGAPADTGRR